MGKKRLETRGYPLVKVLCCDEIAPHKGQGNYCLVLYAPEEGFVLDLLCDRRKATLLRWFEERGTAWCAAVEFFCADMWDAYHEAASERLPNAKTVVDHFHVIKNLHEALSKTRRTLQNQAAEEVKAQLKGARWLLLKPAPELSPEACFELERILTASPALNDCYELKEELRQWFQADHTPASAALALDRWLTRVLATPYKALHAFAHTLMRWRARILNFFEGRHTNAFAEGANLKIKLILRRAFGFRNFLNMRLRVLVAFAT